MKNLGLLVFFVFLAGCFSANRPAASLHFKDFEKNDSGYSVKFDSDIDLITLYDEGVVTRWLMCALEDDHNFSVDHDLNKYFSGDVRSEGRQSGSTAKQFSYVAHGYFYSSFDKGTSTEYIKMEELRELLKQRKSIPCKVVMTIYFSSPYYSKTMNIPVEAILSK